MHCSTLQHTATHCNTLQHTAKYYSTLQHTATHCNTLQHTATHCNTLQYTATHCNIIQIHWQSICFRLRATLTNVLQNTATHMNHWRSETLFKSHTISGLQRFRNPGFSKCCVINSFEGFANVNQIALTLEILLWHEQFLQKNGFIWRICWCQSNRFWHE